MKCRGFTLIELLVVIAIIAILAAILFPVFARARMKAHTATCQSNLKQLAIAIRMYCDEHEGFGPFTDCDSLGRSTWKMKLYRAGFTDHPWYSNLYTCKGDSQNYCMNYYRGGHCASGPGGSTYPWLIDVGVPHPEAVMLVGDARQELGGSADHFYDVWADGKLHPCHMSVNNLAFIDGHVKGCRPSELKAEYDNPLPGKGNWFWWGWQ